MTRARELARLGNENVLSVEDDSLEVGINSTSPTSALDVAGQFNVGTAIKAGVAGVITATEFSGTTGTFSGNVSVGGTLTYEDVTNVDSLGIVTARSGINMSGGQFLVGTGVTIGVAGIATFRTGRIDVGDALLNTSIGEGAGDAYTTGNGNVAIGYAAATNTTTGTQNVAIGADSPCSKKLAAQTYSTAAKTTVIATIKMTAITGDTPSSFFTILCSMVASSFFWQLYLKR